MKRALPILLLLAGCARLAQVCPPLVAYDPAFNERLAVEIEAMPEDSAALRAIGDYIALRDQVRACR